MENIRERRPTMQSYRSRKHVKLRGVGPGRRTMRKVILWFVLTWAVVLANIILLTQLRRQVKDLNAAFVRLQGKLAVIAGDQVLTDQSMNVFSENGLEFQDTIAKHSVVTEDYADLWGLNQVDKPKERTTYEILRRLEELGKDSELIAQVAGGVP